ncbi:hypothetical protein Cni_G29414 [Canna indica]|uniref:Receptor-like serine/threonine-protein kinase n=1 Tax=Canna indica TaxID=4628 RepID=A0AAQ3QR90_9LILI|nr:hypothetical protein Cni_G29414 [Canna indica]
MRFQFIFPLILLSLLHRSLAAPRSTLERGSYLSVEQTDDFLTSPDGTFACGFHQVGTNAFYFAIWFANSKESAVVWTANRDNYVNGRGSRIFLHSDGGLVLSDVDGTTVWETNTTSTGVSAAELLNSGNLVLKDQDGHVHWQSFDSPTDTLLPLQRLTKGKRLLSGIFKDASISGYYSLYFDNDNVLRLMYDGPEISSIYWPSPDYNVYQNGRSNYNSTRIAFLDEAGQFLSSDGFKAVASDSGALIRRRLRMDYDGNLRLYSLNESSRSWSITWQALQQICNVHGLCGQNGICEYSPAGIQCSCPPGYEMSDPTNWNKGCKAKFNISCGNDTRHRQQMHFIELPLTDFYGFDMSTYSTMMTFEACRNDCMRSCDCQGFGYRLAGNGACYPKSFLFNGFRSPNFPGSTFLKVPANVNASSFFNSEQSQLTCNSNSSSVPRSSSDLYATRRSKTKWVYLYTFASALGAIEILFLFIGWCCIFRGQDTAKSVEEGYKMISNQFRRFTYRELREATGKFKEELGRGGSGRVYRGVLDDKRVVAVKKLTNVMQGEEEFWSEMSVIGRINHMNLVRLWGFCSEGKHRLLVYEYVDNQSLDKYLFSRGDSDSGSSLGWNQRFKIALGTARGLAYLHHECLEWVIHCDVKPENILLDREFEPKIADFGLAKLSKRDGSGINFSRMRGTMGYMAPEWALNLSITGKVDVYSYGVVLLELLKGSRVSDWAAAAGADGRAKDMREHVAELKEKLAAGEDRAWVRDVVDHRLGGQFNYEHAVTMAEIAVRCLEEERSRRPSMYEIVKMLMACEEQDSHPAYSW